MIIFFHSDEKISMDTLREKLCICLVPSFWLGVLGLLSLITFIILFEIFGNVNLQMMESPGWVWIFLGITALLWILAYIAYIVETRKKQKSMTIPSGIGPSSGSGSENSLSNISGSFGESNSREESFREDEEREAERQRERESREQAGMEPPRRFRGLRPGRQMRSYSQTDDE